MCLVQGDTGKQGIQGVKGQQVLRENISSSLLIITPTLKLPFIETKPNVLFFFKGERGVKGPKGKVSWESFVGALLKNIIIFHSKYHFSPHPVYFPEAMC